MKRVVRLVVLLAVCCVALVGSLCAQTAKPVATISVSDVHRVIGSAETIATVFDEEMTADMIKAMVGAAVLDPTLAGFGADAGFIIFVLSESNTVGFFEVSKGKIKSYESAVKTFGYSAQVVDELLMVTLTSKSADLAAAKKMLPTAKVFLGEVREPAVQIHAETALLSGLAKPLVDALLGSLKEAADEVASYDSASETEKLAAKLTFGAGLLANDILLNQTQSLDVTLAARGDSLVLSGGCVLKADSPYAKLTQRQGDLNLDLLAKLPAQGAMTRSVSSLNLAQWLQVAASQGKRLLEQMKIAPGKSLERVAYYAEKTGAAFGDGSANVALVGEGTSAQLTLVEVKDAAKAKALIYEVCADLSGLLQEHVLRETSATMSVSYLENAGTVGGVAYDVLDMSVSDGTETLSLGSMPLMMTESLLLIGSDPESLVQLSAQAQKPVAGAPVFSAIKAVPDGFKATYASEIDFSTMFTAMAVGFADSETTAAKELVAEIATNEALKKLPPVLMHSAVKEGEAMSAIVVPVKLLTIGVKAMKTLAAKQMQLMAAEEVLIDTELNADEAETTATE